MRPLLKEGDLPAAVGGIGYLSFLAAIFGLWLSVQLRKDNEAYGPMVQGAFYVNLAAVIDPRIYFFCRLFINYYVGTDIISSREILDVRA